MRIGVNLLFLRPGKVGGGEVYVRSLLAEMATRVDAPMVLFCFEDAAATFEPAPTIQVVACVRGSYSAGRRLVGENWALRQHVGNRTIDVLFSPAAYAPALLPSRVPQVATIHDLQHVSFPGNFSFGTRLARAVLIRGTLLRCRRIMTVSEFSRQELLQFYGLAPERVVAAPLGVDFPSVPSPGSIDAARTAHRLTRPYVCYPAVVAPHKNHETLFRALADLRRRAYSPPLLALTGASPEAFSRLMRTAEAQEVADIVRPLGYLPRSELQAVLAGASALVFPSRFEGFGMPLLEAMRMNVPVVSSRAASLGEVAGEAALLLPPNDVPAWASAILQVVSDHALRARLVAAGTVNLQRFSWAHCATQTLSVLAAAASRG
jgi:glycosyltransferase involved in cell wall biosynthesis